MRLGDRHAFSSCVLMQNIGAHKAGETFNLVIIDYEKGNLELYTAVDVKETYSLLFSIGEKIS
jgi:hypothetical protein